MSTKNTAKEGSQQIEVTESQRVLILAPADYREESELMRFDQLLKLIPISIDQIQQWAY